MARAFTTLFHYCGKAFTAVITQIDGSVSFYVPDENLHYIIPDGRFSYNPRQGLKLDGMHLNPIHDLIVCILAAVEQQNKKHLCENARS